MKKFIVLVLAALFLAGCSQPLKCDGGDIGPSPAVLISVTNASDYFDYDFYYGGNIETMDQQISEEKTNVYKLNTYGAIYAVPKGQRFDRKDAIVSQEFNLVSCQNNFEISSINSQNKTLVVKNDERGYD